MVDIVNQTKIKYKYTRIYEYIVYLGRNRSLMRDSWKITNRRLYVCSIIAFVYSQKISIVWRICLNVIINIS